MTTPASYLQRISPFYAVDVFQAANALEAEGRSITHLEFGESDLPTPAPIQEAALKAMGAGYTRYTHTLGILPLREEICRYHQAKYGNVVQPEQVLVSAGTSLLTHLLFALLLEPGDEVILPDPTYACYTNFVTMAGGTPVGVPLSEEEGFQLDPAAVAACISPRTKALVICSPANPTGVVLRPEVLRALVELGVPVVSDEIYHGLTYSGAEQSVLNHTEQAFVLNGFSKYFAMTGWRLGYLIFPPALQAEVMKMHQNIMISAAEFIQHAGIAALREAIPECERYKGEYDRRRLYMIQRLEQMGLPLKYEPAGAFYCFVDARRYGGNSLELSMKILQEAEVAVAPGVDFGAAGEGYLRLSYANSLENIAAGMDRLEGWLAKRV